MGVGSRMLLIDVLLDSRQRVAPRVAGKMGGGVKLALGWTKTRIRFSYQGKEPKSRFSALVAAVAERAIVTAEWMGIDAILPSRNGANDSDSSTDLSFHGTAQQCGCSCRWVLMAGGG